MWGIGAQGGLRAPPACTAADTPEIRARVARDLGHVLATLRAEDPGLRALVLTGGFARGEGSCLRGAPLNDYDLVALRATARRPGRGYESIRSALEADLGLHLDLAPVRSARLRWVRPSIFWYETALRGHVLWGDASLLERIPVRSAAQVPPVEGLRLLANRAAGLLLVAPETVRGDRASRSDGDGDPGRAPLRVRIQACKALLAALDAGLLAHRRFAPSQRERWELRQAEGGSAGASPRRDALAWAMAFKLDPGGAPPRHAGRIWREAGNALLDAVPGALRAAGMRTIQDFARRDHPAENLAYRWRAGDVPGARRWALHPTGRVRAAALAMLALRLDRDLPGIERRSGPLDGLIAPAPGGRASIHALDRLRRVTMP